MHHLTVHSSLFQGTVNIFLYFKVIIHTLWLNQTLLESVNMYHLHHQLSGKLMYEDGFEKVHRYSDNDTVLTKFKYRPWVSLYSLYENWIFSLI